MEYIVTLTLSLDTPATPERVDYAEHTLRTAVNTSVHKVLDAINNNMPGGITISNVNTIAVSRVMPEDSRR